MTQSTQSNRARPVQLFVLGDSISIHYGPALERLLPDGIVYARKGQTRDMPAAQVNAADMAANGGDSSMAHAYLHARYTEDDFRPDVLLLNCGLHDIKTNTLTGAQQIPPETYRANLAAMLALAQAHKTSVVWVHTTPVDDALHNTREATFRRFDADVQARNRNATDIFGCAGCPIIDLYSFTTGIDGVRYCDHVHFTARMRELQGAYIAGYLTAALAGLGTLPATGSD